MKKLNVVTLFSGYDSQCQALDRLGIDYNLIAWSDIDAAAIKAHNAIYPQYKDKNLGDVCEIDWSTVEDFDLMTYSSPCTDFSTSGLQLGGECGSGTRSSLLWECKRAIEAKHPKYLVFENVKNLVSKKFIGTFNKWIAYLETQGYETKWTVLNAKEFDVPQNRERVIAVSSLDGLGDFRFPDGLQRTKTLADIIEKDVPDDVYFTPEKAIDAFRNSNVNISLSDEYAVLHNFYQGNDMRISKDLQSSVKLPLLDVRVGALRGRNPLNPSERSCSNGKYQQRLEISNNPYTNTLTTVAKDNVIVEIYPDNVKLRYLTTRESFRLMDMDDSNIDKIQNAGIGKSAQIKLAGNSICVGVLTEVFRYMFDKTKRNQVALF
jgi:DNA (cytosine-5)-methyltransferase 1